MAFSFKLLVHLSIVWSLIPLGNLSPGTSRRWLGSAVNVFAIARWVIPGEDSPLHWCLGVKRREPQGRSARLMSTLQTVRVSVGATLICKSFPLQSHHLESRNVKNLTQDPQAAQQFTVRRRRSNWLLLVITSPAARPCCKWRNDESCLHYVGPFLEFQSTRKLFLSPFLTLQSTCMFFPLLFFP